MAQRSCGVCGGVGNTSRRSWMWALTLDVATVDYRYGFVGARFWGQVRGFSRRLRLLRAECSNDQNPAELHGNRCTKPTYEIA